MGKSIICSYDIIMNVKDIALKTIIKLSNFFKIAQYTRTLKSAASKIQQVSNRISSKSRMYFKKIVMLHKSCRGSVLIECAIVLPVLLATLYYAVDSPRYERFTFNMKKTGYLMVSMMQVLTPSNKNGFISLAEIKRITSTAFLSFFGDANKQFSTSSSPPYKYKLGYRGQTLIFCIKGTSDGRAAILWAVDAGHISTYSNPQSVQHSHYSSRSLIKTPLSIPVDPITIHHQLRIKPGELKIILDVSLASGPEESFLNGTPSSSRSSSVKFGFACFPPSKRTNSTYFNNVIIFTPKGNAFKDTPPT